MQVCEYAKLMHTAIWVIIFCVVCLTAVVAYIAISNNQHRKRLEAISTYNINTSAIINADIPGLLELLINETFDDLKVKLLLPLDERYINSEREAEIRDALVAAVGARMSPAMIDKLSLFYNPKNIGSILADKIYISVMNYVIDHNKSYTEE